MTSWTSPTSSSEVGDLLLHRASLTGRGQVEVAFTASGISVAERPESPGAVEQDLARLSGVIGVPIARMRQVHGIDVHEVVLDANGGFGDVPEADALVTRAEGVALLTRSADCVPVLLADVEAGVIGALHAGRVGFDAGVVTATVEKMRSMGADTIVAWIGPAACGNCYEVPEEMSMDVAGRHPAALSRTSWGTPALDVVAGVRAELEGHGVTGVDLSICTIEDERTHSYRRQGDASGRLGGLIWIAA